MVMAMDCEYRPCRDIPLGDAGKHRYLTAFTVGADPHEISLQDRNRGLQPHIMIGMVDTAVFPIPAHHMALSL